MPLDLIFLNHARYEEHGSRWLPLSLLSQNCPFSRPLPLSAEQATVRINYDFQKKEKTIAGLNTVVPALSLNLCGTTARFPRAFRLKALEDNCAALNPYVGRVYKAGDTEAPDDLPTRELVLILPVLRPPMSGNRNDESQPPAVRSGEQIIKGQLPIPNTFVAVLASVEKRPLEVYAISPNRAANIPSICRADELFWEVRHEALIELDRSGDWSDAEEVEVDTLTPGAELGMLYCLKIV